MPLGSSEPSLEHPNAKVVIFYREPERCIEVTCSAKEPQYCNRITARKWRASSHNASFTRKDLDTCTINRSAAPDRTDDRLLQCRHLDRHRHCLNAGQDTSSMNEARGSRAMEQGDAPLREH